MVRRFDSPPGLKWIPIIRPLAKVFFATDFTDDFIVKNFFTAKGAKNAKKFLKFWKV